MTERRDYAKQFVEAKAKEWKSWSEENYIFEWVDPVSYTHLTLPTIYSV